MGSGPSLLQSMLRQRAVLWPRSGTDPYGKPTLGNPVQVSVRWDDVTKTFLADDGETQQPLTKVYVDRDVVKGSKMMLADLTSGFDVNPDNHPGLVWEVVRFERFPNFECDDFLRTVYVQR